MKLSLNTATIKKASLEEAIAGCVDAGITGIGPWRDVVAAAGGAARSARLLRDAGLTVTSLCRGGFFTSPDWLLDNRAAVEEAAILGTRELVLVCGGLPTGSRDLRGARDQVLRGLETLAPYASSLGVRLAIEPLHPMFCADRAVVSTLGQALELASHFAPSEVGVVVDTYHVWWDPQLFASIAAAAGRISAYQVCDWILPLPSDALLGRGHVGDGYIDFAPITEAVLATGYDGYVEVEIFNQHIWDTPYRDTIATVVERHTAHVPPRS